MKTNSSLITYEQSLNGVKNQFGRSLPVYDDGYGPLFIHRDSMGISGIVRAQTWEDAYSICEDEFFPEATETIEELKKEYDFKRENVKIVRYVGRTDEFDARAEHYPFDEKGIEFVRWETRTTPEPDAWPDNVLFQESFGFRPNGPRKGDVNNHGIYSKDLNGDSLELLTPELVAHLELTLDISTNE